MPPKLKWVGVPPGVSAGVPPPNDGAASGGAICDGPPGLSSVAPPLGGGTPVDVSFVETNGAMQQLSNTQLSTYLASLSELEQRVCSIARDHLESSFDLSRSSGFIAWAGKK